MTTDLETRDSDAAIVMKGLTKSFGRKTALADVSLTVPRGKVFGLVGENGAGKTTLIKHILGLLIPSSGSVRVFGMDPVASPERVLGRIGFLSENRDMPGWMRISELLRFTSTFYPQWSHDYARELLDTFSLDPRAKVKHLSRGERAQAGLLIALAHRPDLLVLDEPSSGLDPVVRRDILSAVIRAVADEGRTVLFSSHLLEEVDRVADHITMIYKGRVVLSSSRDEIHESHRVLTIKFQGPQSSPPALPGTISCEGAGDEWNVLCCDSQETTRACVEKLGAVILEERTPSLEDVFVAKVRASRRTN